VGFPRVGLPSAVDRGFASAPASHHRGVAFALALAVHALLFWGLAWSISFTFLEPDEPIIEPKIVAVAPRLVPPPPDVDRLGPTDVVIKALPRFRPRIPTIARERRPGDPALAVWKYLCNRDFALSVATERACPAFHFSDVDLGMTDPLNRNGDVGALFGPDTTTMSLDEVAKKKRWTKPKMPWSQDGARAKGDDLGLPGHNPFDFLPKERSQIWGGSGG
jgi:hypothetical protein